MKKLITSAAVVLGLAVAGNAMAQETILNTMTKANNALEEAQQKIDEKKAELEAQKAAREQAQQEKADAVKLQMDDTDAKIKAEQERLRNNLDNLKNLWAPINLVFPNRNTAGKTGGVLIRHNLFFIQRIS